MFSSFAIIEKEFRSSNVGFTETHNKQDNNNHCRYKKEYLHIEAERNSLDLISFTMSLEISLKSIGKLEI